jgi:hypothetical protein
VLLFQCEKDLAHYFTASKTVFKSADESPKLLISGKAKILLSLGFVL